MENPNTSPDFVLITCVASGIVCVVCILGSYLCKSKENEKLAEALQRKKELLEIHGNKVSSNDTITSISESPTQTTLDGFYKVQDSFSNVILNDNFYNSCIESANYFTQLQSQFDTVFTNLAAPVLISAIGMHVFMTMMNEKNGIGNTTFENNYRLMLKDYFSDENKTAVSYFENLFTISLKNKSALHQWSSLSQVHNLFQTYKLTEHEKIQAFLIAFNQQKVTVEKPYTSIITQDKQHSENVLLVAAEILRGFHYNVSFTEKFNPTLNKFTGSFNTLKNTAGFKGLGSSFSFYRVGLTYSRDANASSFLNNTNGLTSLFRSSNSDSENSTKDE